jgi:hypothetical protein
MARIDILKLQPRERSNVLAFSKFCGDNDVEFVLEFSDGVLVRRCLGGGETKFETKS